MREFPYEAQAKSALLQLRNGLVSAALLTIRVAPPVRRVAMPVAAVGPVIGMLFGALTAPVGPAFRCQDAARQQVGDDERGESGTSVFLIHRHLQW